MMKLLARLATILLLLCGCSKSYTENEKLNYFDDVQEVVSVHQTAIGVDPAKLGSMKGRELIQGPLEGAHDSFKRKYQGTDLDKDFGYVARAGELGERLNNYSIACSAIETRAMAKMLGKEDEITRGDTPTEDAKGINESKARYQAVIDETLTSLKEARSQ